MNPEIRRHIWSDLSTTRLVAAPVLLALIFYSLSSAQSPAAVIIWVNGMMVALCIWGMGQTANSVSDEVTRNTWDWQRLAPQSALSLAVGKIFGAPIFVWYCFGLCAVVYILAASARELEGLAIGHWLFHWFAIYVIFFSFSLINSVESARTLRAIRRPTNRFVRGIVLFFIIYSLGSGLISAFFQVKDGIDYQGLLTSSIKWWNITLPGLIFIDISLIVWAAWGLCGAYRALRAELQFRFGPWAWLAFLFFLAVYFTPLVFKEPTLTRFCFVLFIASALSTYVNLFREDKDTVALRKLFSSRTENFPWYLVSCWICSLPVMLGSLVALLILPDSLATGGYYKLPAISGKTMAVAATLHIIRDGCLLLGIHLRNPRHPRNDLAFAFYLACLYGIIPGCLALISMKSALLAFFWPIRSVVGGEWSGVLYSLPLCLASVYFFSSSLYRQSQTTR